MAAALRRQAPELAATIVAHAAAGASSSNAAARGARLRPAPARLAASGPMG
jgi:hypothetical protein